MQRVSQPRRRVATKAEANARERKASSETVRVAAAIIERRGMVLACQRRRGERFAGQWEFPGGKINPHETPRAALARELREELAAPARVGREVYRLRYRYPGMSSGVAVIFFRATLLRAPRNVCFARIRWIKRGDLPRLHFLVGNRGLVAKLARGEFRK